MIIHNHNSSYDFLSYLGFIWDYFGFLKIRLGVGRIVDFLHY